MADDLRGQPAAGAIAELLTALRASGAGEPTVRQRRWALNEYLGHLARTRGVFPDRVNAAELLDPAAAEAWYAEAAAGATRRRGTTGDPRAGHGSSRARVTSFNALAEHLGHPARLAPLPPAYDTPLPRHEAERLIRTIADSRPATSNPVTLATWERTSALAALVADTGASISDVAVLRLADLSLDTRPVTVRLPQDSHPLGELTAAVLRRWLDTRAVLTATVRSDRPGVPGHRLQGGEVQEVWVTTRPGRPQPGRSAAPAGLPASVRALHHAHRALTARLTGAPTRLGLLRSADAAPQAHPTIPAPKDRV